MGTLLFIERVSNHELAEFIVRQSEAIEGLGKNLDSYIKEFRKIHEKLYADENKVPKGKEMIE